MTRVIDDFNTVHNNKYDYSKVEYVNNYTKIEIICPVHGVFKQVPKSHKRGHGCPDCSRNRKLTLSEFILRSTNVHGGIYDYSNSTYSGVDKDIEIICPIHGVFHQIARSHMNGHGCFKCFGNKKMSNEVFIKMSNKVHGHVYSYDETRYRNLTHKVKIRCSEHGLFEVSPRNHIHNQSGCPECSHNFTKSVDYYIKHFNEIHSDKYVYKQFTSFDNSKDKIKIECPIHKVFEMRINDHYMGHGCPKCSSSNGEKYIRERLVELGIHFIEQYSFDNCYYKNKLRFDFYIPGRNLIIEYDGVQHFKPIDFFGGIESFKETKIRDDIKNKYCGDNNINMIRISYKENIDEKINEIIGVIE